MSRLDFSAGMLLTLTIGVVIVLIFVLILRGIRYGLQHNHRWIDLQCPRCQNDLSRIHRHCLDHLISLLVPVRRYRCNYPTCRWVGLRVKSNDPKKRKIDSQPFFDQQIK